MYKQERTIMRLRLVQVLPVSVSCTVLTYVITKICNSCTSVLILPREVSVQNLENLSIHFEYSTSTSSIYSIR